jgi:hypothetical protein
MKIFHTTTQKPPDKIKDSGIKPQRQSRRIVRPANRQLEYSFLDDPVDWEALKVKDRNHRFGFTIDNPDDLMNTSLQ